MYVEGMGYEADLSAPKVHHISLPPVTSQEEELNSAHELLGKEKIKGVLRIVILDLMDS